MAKFVLAYTGGAMAGTPEEQEKAMGAWMQWFGSLGPAVLDAGNPFGASCTVGSDGSPRDGGSSGLTGYSIIEATDVSDASSKAKGCPVLSAGGSIEVYEAMPIG